MEQKQPSSQEIERLLKDLQSRDAFVRQTAAGEAGKLKIKDERIISVLRSLGDSDSSKYVREVARQALMDSSYDINLSEWKCAQCGQTQKYPVLTNHCLICNASILSSHRIIALEDPQVGDPYEVTCLAPKPGITSVLAMPDVNSETLYVIGPGDLLPIAGEEGKFYQVQLYRGELGYVEKSLGKQYQLGAGKVKQPLGFARQLDSNYPAEVYFTQPDGAIESLYSLKKEDNLPIVAESEHAFKVQLSSGLRGWVNKGRVIRVVSETSLRVQESSAGVVLGALALGGILALGAILGRDSNS